MDDAIELVYLACLPPALLVLEAAERLAVRLGLELLELQFQLLYSEFLLEPGPVELCIFVAVELLSLVGEVHLVLEDGVVDEQRVVFGAEGVEVVLAGRAAAAVMHYYRSKEDHEHQSQPCLATVSSLSPSFSSTSNNCSSFRYAVDSADLQARMRESSSE